ncbi:cysteine hydrolase family protein [Microbacterium sp. E-13]|uniref:cysteine hydrolase family protein n=1 Tax=Microbacterium sp. E-13 TaxID=3404048 RepID=UPI003CE8D4EE
MTRALILIDLQVGLCDPSGTASAGLAERVASGQVLERAAELLAHFRATKEPIVHVRLGFAENFSNRTNRTPRFDSHEAAGRFLESSRDCEFCAPVAPAPGETTLTKGSVGAFASTPLLAVLRAGNIDELVLAGVATHLAIESTAREAADRSFAVTVAADATTGPDPLHTNSLDNVLPGFAHVTTVADIIAEAR